MPLFAFIAKTALKALAVFGIAKIFHWALKDEFRDDLSPPDMAEDIREHAGRILFCLFLLALIIAALIGFAHLPYDARDSFQTFVIETLKWPMIAFTFFGVNWVLWRFFWGGPDNTIKTFFGEFHDRTLLYVTAFINIIMLWGVQKELSGIIDITPVYDWILYLVTLL